MRIVKKLLFTLILAALPAFGQVEGNPVNAGTGADRLTVNTTGQTGGQCLIYSATNSRWEPTSCATPGNITCNKSTIGEADLTTASTTEDETLFTAGQFQKLSAIIVKHSTAFTGGGLTGMTVSVGTSSDPTAYSATFDIFQTASDTVFQDTNLIKSTTMASGGHTVIARFTSTGGNVSAATAGSVDIWACSVPDIDSASGSSSVSWEDLVNTADTATSYTSNNTAETVTFDFLSAFGASQQFLIRQQTGNPTAGTLLDVRAADTDVTVFRAGDGTNGITVSQAGALTAEGTGSITATAIAANTLDATTEISGSLCGTNEILEDQGASWACIATPGGGGNSFGVIGAATADTGNDTITVTDGLGVDLTTTNDPEDLTATWAYGQTLAGNPPLGTEECVATTDGAGGGGFICEGTGAGDTNEQLYLFPAVNGADTTNFMVVNGAQVTAVDGTALTVSGGTLNADSAAAATLGVIELDNALAGSATDVELASAVAGNGIALNTATTPDSLDVDLNATADGVGSGGNLSGLEFTATNELALLQGCADNNILKWDDGTSQWNCEADGGTSAWESLVNSADTATSYLSNNTAETVTFSFESAFSTSQFVVRQQIGNPTAGTLFQVRATDPDPVLSLFQRGVDGATVLLTLDNEQAAAASSVNETADLRGTFAGTEAGLLRWGKTEDYTVSANESSFFAIHTRTDGATAEAGRFVANGVLDVTTGFRIGGGATTGRFLRGNGTNYIQSSGAASGIGSCTNQFVRALNDDSAPTCASVASADITDGDVAPADVTSSLKTDQFCYSLFDTASAIPDAADIPSIWMTRAKAVTITEVRCETDAGTPSINLQRDDGSPANILSSNLTCTTGGANGTIDTNEDNLAVGNNVDHVTVSGSTSKRINVCVTYTVD